MTFRPHCQKEHFSTDNISCPENGTDIPFDTISLKTMPVEVASVTPVYITAEEGTLFADLTPPTQVVVTLSSIGLDGEPRTITTGVNWGTGAGYNPFPDGLTDDTPVTMEVTGTLADYPAYVKGSKTSVSLYVTMTRVYDLVSASPSRFPATGSMKVNYGSSLSQIYEKLESHEVELTLQNRKGDTTTVTVTFQLREDENGSYDPTSLNEHTLKGYIPLAGNIRNPEELGVDIVVQPTKYTISSIKVPRITGVLVNTPFAEIEKPETVTVLRNDKSEEDVSVTWIEGNYNPSKLGSQVIKGTLVTPLPIHLENPNSRQPRAIITVEDPSAQILSLQQLPKDTMMFAAAEGGVDAAEEPLPGFTEYRYLAEVLYEDGTVDFEVISVFVETEME